MRILVITDLYPPVGFGGYEMECAALVRWLRRSHDVLVLTSDRDRNTAVPEKDVRRELPYVAFRRFDSIRAPAATVRAARITRLALSELDPDLVYMSNNLAVPQVGALLAVHAGAPVAYRLSERFYARALHRGDLYMASLDGPVRGARKAWGRLVRMVNHHPALGFDPETPIRAAISWCSESLRRDVELPSTVEPAFERVIYPASEHGAALAQLERRPAEQKTIAYVGRVTTPKGVEVAYRALAALRDAHGIEARLVLAGNCTSAMRSQLDALAGELGIREHVELPGFLPADQLGALLQSAHGLVVPSLAHEAFPLACVEGALARVPIVAARVGGIPEVVVAGEHALLFEPGDAAACARALAETFHDPAATNKRVGRAFKHARGFSLERYLRASEEFIRDAAAAFGERRASAASS
jgi:glycosyltransferase involved in cell wall biosynthesis